MDCGDVDGWNYGDKVWMGKSTETGWGLENIRGDAVGMGQCIYCVTVYSIIMCVILYSGMFSDIMKPANMSLRMSFRL